jgi:glutamyl-tRNA synthetase
MKIWSLSSKRKKTLYREYADQLINTGWAYYAFDSAEALDAARKEQEEQGKTFIYNHTNRETITSLVISTEETAKRIANGDAYVIRFKTHW